MTIIIELYIQFFIIGATAFGGGYAILPLINQFVVGNKGWLTLQEMTDLVSISNMTPGPIAINSATFVGMKMAGLPGAIAATLGVVSPSFILMGILAYFLFTANKKLKFLDKMLITLRPTVVGLIAIASLDMTINSIFVNDLGPSPVPFNIVPAITFVIGLVFYFKKYNMIKLIIVGGILGVLLTAFFQGAFI